MKAPYIKTIVACCMIMGAMIATMLSFGFFMDPVTRELGFERGAFSLYITMISLVGMVSLPVYGRVIARVGTRRVALVAGAWTGACIACLALCKTLVQFYIVGALAGLGFFGSTYAVVPVVVSNWFAQRDGFVMGLASAAGGVLSILVSMTFPSLIAQMGWRVGYCACGCLFAFLVVFAALFLLRSKPAELGLSPYGAEEGVSAREGSHAPEQGVMLGAAVKMPSFWLICASMLVLSASITITQHLAAFFTGQGFDAVATGAFMSVAACGVVVASFAGGALIEKLGLSRTLIICTVLYAASFVMLSKVSLALLICVAVALLAIGNCYTSLFAPTVVSCVFGTRDYAALWGVVSMVTTLGQAVGAPLWGLSFDLSGSYVVGMWIACVVCLLALAVLVVCLRGASRR